VANGKLDALNERLDKLRAQIDDQVSAVPLAITVITAIVVVMRPSRVGIQVDGFGVRAVRALLEASWREGGGTDGALFMQGFRPLIKEWASEGGGPAAAGEGEGDHPTAAAAAKVDSGLRATSTARGEEARAGSRPRGRISPWPSASRDGAARQQGVLTNTAAGR
jgi:hypothetical protein